MRLDHILSTEKIRVLMLNFVEMQTKGVQFLILGRLSYKAC